MFAPCWGAAGGHTLQGGLQALVGAFRVSIGVGGNPMPGLTVAPIPFQKACHTWEENWGSRSETMSRGMPWRRTTWITRSLAVSAITLEFGECHKVGLLGKTVNYG